MVYDLSLSHCVKNTPKINVNAPIANDIPIFAQAKEILFVIIEARNASTMNVKGENFEITERNFIPEISKNTPLKNRNGIVISVPIPNATFDFRRS